MATRSLNNRVEPSFRVIKAAFFARLGATAFVCEPPLPLFSHTPHSVLFKSCLPYTLAAVSVHAIQVS